ncbi:MAG: peptidase domain-containing ABC transporter [Myxococcota bacterium]
MNSNTDPTRIILQTSDEDSVLSVIVRAAQLVGVQCDIGVARTSFRAACHGQGAVASGAGPLTNPAQAVGLDARLWFATLREAWVQSRDDLPVIAPAASCTSDASGGPAVSDAGASGWLILGGRRGWSGIEAWAPAADDRPLRLTWKKFRARFPDADDTRVYPFFLISAAAPATNLIGVPGTSPSPFGRLAALLSAERRDLGVVLSYAIGVGVLGLATPLVVQVLVNTVAFTALSTPVFLLAAILLSCLAFAAVLRGLKKFAVEVLQRRIFVRMSADLAWRLPRVKVAAFDRKRASEVVNHFFDVLTVQKAASSLLIDGLSAAIQAVVGLILLAIYHPALLGFGIFLIAAIVVLLVGLGKSGPATAIAESKAKYRVAGWLEEIAGHPGLFKLPGGARLALERADNLSHSYLDAREAHFRVFFRQYVGTLGLQVVAASVLLGLGGWLVVERQLSLGQLVAAELVVAAVLAAYAKFADKLDIFYDLLAGLDKLGVLVDLPLERQVGGLPADTGEAVELEISDLAFAFPGGQPVLRGIDLRLMPGETAIIHGADGAGKSVLADLIFGLRTPSQGHVRFDECDLRELRPKAVRGCAALTRGPEVVSSSLIENIALGRPEVSAEQVRWAVAVAGLQEVVSGLEQGLDTELTPSGAPLSSTQVLRLMIARAVVGRPRIIVVDHTLDAFDVPARDELLGALTGPDAPWTLIILTQDRRCLDIPGRRYRLLNGTLVSSVAGPTSMEAS